MVVAAALFLSLSLLFGIVAAYQQQLETQVQHDGNYRSNRTWTVNYEFMLCGDIRITRIDRQRVDVPAPTATMMPHQKFSLQWNYQPEGDFTLGEMLVAMSQKRYMVRVFAETPNGTEVKYFYFSPFGGAFEKMPPLPDEAKTDMELLYFWMMLHDWTPPAEHNPRVSAFDNNFSKLVYQLDARMHFGILLEGPGCGDVEIVLPSQEL